MGKTKVNGRLERVEQLLWDIEQHAIKVMDLENAVADAIHSTVRGVYDPPSPDLETAKRLLDDYRLALRTCIRAFMQEMNLHEEFAALAYADRMRRLGEQRAKERGQP